MTTSAPHFAPAVGTAERQRWQEYWQQRWYPVACLSDLDPARPSAFTLLGTDLVLWFDRAAEQWRAFADVCPHRLVPLSEGRLNGAGELECPYHGWSFNGRGQCTAIPQAEPEAAATACASPRSQCRSYATACGQGLLFVFAGDPDGAGAVSLPLGWNGPTCSTTSTGLSTKRSRLPWNQQTDPPGSVSWARNLSRA